MKLVLQLIGVILVIAALVTGSITLRQHGSSGVPLILVILGGALIRWGRAMA